MAHWTERSVDDFLYRIGQDFMTQLEQKIQSEHLSRSELAEKLGVSKGRVSQILNNPEKLSLKMMVRCARILGMKLSIVAYDDDDYHNDSGPINSEIFRMCWENYGKPKDFWELGKPNCVATNTVPTLQTWLIVSMAQSGSLSESATSVSNVQLQQAERLSYGKSLNRFTRDAP